MNNFKSNICSDKIKQIKNKIKDIEKQKGISVIHSCIIKTPPFGIEDKNSDLNIRLIYMDRPEWYFKVNKDSGFNGLAPELNDYYFEEQDDNLNIIGYGLYKTFEMITNSSPFILELLRSKLVLTTCDVPMITIRKICENSYRPYKVFSIYRKLARSLYGEIRSSRNECGNETLPPKLISDITLFIKYVLSKSNYDTLCSTSVNFEQLVDDANIPNDIKEMIYNYFKFIDNYQGIGNIDHINSLLESLYKLNEIPYNGDIHPVDIDIDAITKFHMNLVINHFKE